MTDKILHCDLHDYLEIACMFHYQVQLILRSGDVISGLAHDTRINDAKQELLELQIQNSSGKSEVVAIPVLSLQQLRVLTEGARFKQVDFV